MTEEYKVVRIIVYKGSKEWLQKQLGRSMNDGVIEINKKPANTITVATAYSNLPVALEENSEEKNLYDVAKEDYEEGKK